MQAIGKPVLKKFSLPGRACFTQFRAIPAVFLCLFALLAAAFSTAAQANSKYAGIVLDAKTGKVLYADKADSARYPASLTKIMTLYMLFEELEAGRMSLDTRLKVSKHAAGMPPSKLGLKAGSTIRAEDAIRALVTKSANDIAVVVAEHISGSESKFAARMSARAGELGMARTSFYNASGLPHSKQRTTARDMARLGIAIQERFPQYYKYFSTKVFQYNGHSYRNHNRLLGSVGGVNGIKTGYIRASGFNLVTSVERDSRHIVAVVMGGRTGPSRDAHMKDLIRRYFRRASTGPRTLPLIAARPVPLPKTRASALATPLPPSNLDEIITASITPTDQRALATVETGSIDPSSTILLPKGWQIQIGAVPSHNAAKQLLNSALNRGGAHLSGVQPFTEPVVKNGQTLYRARFAGFGDKTAARQACRYLERQEFACLALQG